MNVGAGGKVQFAYSLDAKTFTPIGDIFTAAMGRWVGAQMGLFSVGEDGKSFVAELSGQKNMKNVDVAGQTHRSWPSPYTNVRQPTDNISNGNHIYPTYMVGSDKSLPQRINTLLGSPTYAQPMAVYRNGILIRYEHQSGKKK